MFDDDTSPPSLRFSPSPSDSGSASRDATPAPPGIFAASAAKRSERQQEPLLPRSKPPIDVRRPTTRLAVGGLLLEPDFDDHTFPLFGASASNGGMADDSGLAVVSRQTSTSPRGNQPSNLTAAFRRSESASSETMNGGPAVAPQPVPTSEHSSAIPVPDAGTRPISVKGKQNSQMSRRESVAQSLGMGMSWGGVSVSSWIRDDMMMAGTSPFAFHQSPSYHSSSYLPKLEANFMKDFSCCGLTLPTLHDLLQHYEEAHAQKDPVSNDLSQPVAMPDSRAAIAANTAQQVQQEAQQRAQHQQPFENGAARPFSSQSNTSRSTPFANNLQTIPDMDTVDDMEMDDIDATNESTPPSSQFQQTSDRASPSTQFAPKPPQVPQLNTNMMQGHQAYRNSTPNTPIASTRTTAAFPGNNVSSTLMANPMQQFQDLQNQYRSTPDSSAPGTPGELDEGLMSGMDDMSMSNNALYNNAQNFGNFGFGMNNDMIDLCIDEPAKRLFQSNQDGNQPPQQSRLGTEQYGPNSEIARRIREQQMLAGLPDTTTNILPHEEPKPFRCPVIGCEKAYKNQNGLKYHKAHGHNNQSLHENGDGTFSIVNPDTQAPYPGTMGMEKEKPYKCDVCQKRYKNLNGLKYHKTHSPPCNPELLTQQQQHSSSGAAGQTPLPNLLGSPGMNLGNSGIGGLSGDLNMT